LDLVHLAAQSGRIEWVKLLKNKERQKEIKARAELVEAQVSKLKDRLPVSGADGGTEVRIVALLAFELVLKGELKGLTSFDLAKEHPIISELFQAELKSPYLQRDYLSHLLQDILNQFTGDSEYDDEEPLRGVAIFAALFAVIESIKGTVPEGEIVSIVKASLLAGLVRDEYRFRSLFVDYRTDIPIVFHF